MVWRVRNVVMAVVCFCLVCGSIVLFASAYYDDALGLHWWRFPLAALAFLVGLIAYSKLLSVADEPATKQAAPEPTKKDCEEG